MKAFTEVEKNYLMECCDQLQAPGTDLRSRFEAKFASRFEAKFGRSSCHGILSLQLSLKALGVKAGDEVILPGLVTTDWVQSVLNLGAVPVFADVLLESWTLDPSKLEKKVTPKTKVILAQALYGLPPDLDPILEIAKKSGIKVVEENSHAFLGFYKGKLAGTRGDLAHFSLISPNPVHCGQGGIAVFSDESLQQAFVADSKGDSDYALSNICAAVALGQTERLDEIVSYRQKVLFIYFEVLFGCDWIRPQLIPTDMAHTGSVCPLILDSNAKASWGGFRKKLVDLGGVAFEAAAKPPYLEPRFASLGYKYGTCPVAEAIQTSIMLFKTDFETEEDAKKNAALLADAISAF